jgi:hypothetical protein
LRNDLQLALIGLQTFQVFFLALHDWIPLGRLNNVAAARSENPGGRLLRTTVISTVPYAVGLAFSIADFGRSYPGWLMYWLWISYVLLFLGQLRAWWVPYLLIPDPQRAARYRVMFANTWAFLPERNGIVPNALHIILHISTLATLVVLALIARGGGQMVSLAFPVRGSCRASARGYELT